MQTDIRKALFGAVVAATGLVGGASLALAHDDDYERRVAAGQAEAPEAAASAADIGPAANWNGVYIGLNGGIGSDNSVWTYNPTSINTNNPGGGVVGLDAGYRRQAGWAVVGIEGNADFAGIEGHSVCPDDEYQCTTRINGLESVRGIVGYAAGRWLIYGTGGLAWEQVDRRVSPSNDLSRVVSTGQVTKTGWAAGIGLDAALSSRIALGTQFLHYNFGDSETMFYSPYTNQTSPAYKFRDSADVLTARVTFRFNSDDHHTPLK